MSLHAKIEAPTRTKRTRVLMTALLMTAGGAQKVTVRDVSRSGAHVVGVKGICADCDVIFRRGDLFAAARIAWIDGDEAGLRFYRELSPDDIEGSLPTSLLPKR